MSFTLNLFEKSEVPLQRTIHVKIAIPKFADVTNSNITKNKIPAKKGFKVQLSGTKCLEYSHKR
jgi:hypothetical protein